jgi:hypothetical protein
MPKVLRKKVVKKKSADHKASERRRDLLAAVSKLAGVMAVLGVSGKSILGKPGQSLTSERDKAVQDLFQYAIQTGDMETAILKYARKAELLEKHLKALRSLTEDDLKILHEIQDKLAVAGGRLAQNW